MRGGVKKEDKDNREVGKESESGRVQVARLSSEIKKGQQVATRNVISYLSAQEN